MEELLKEINAKLDAIKGLLTGSPLPVEAVEPPKEGMGYLPAYNLYPWPGVDYGVIPECPPGYHIEYDYNNNTAVCLKTCGKLGSR
jgi:hypothetical protein